MKKLLAALILIPALLSGQNRYSNPILHLDYSDPDVCRVGEDYYLTASSFNCFPGLPILHSKDLVNWEYIGAALTDYPGEGGPEGDFRNTVQHGNGVWAPAIRYHDGWYYIYCGDPDRGVFMVRTQDPAGPWEPPVWVVRQKGFIDPCPLWDTDGKAWLSHGLAGSRAGLKSVLFMAPMSADGTHLTGPSTIIYDGHLTQPTIEGTKMYKRDGWYYIFSPAGGVSTGWQTVLRSRNPYGPYEERIVMAWAPGTINGPHQGAWVDSHSGDWFIHFQDKGAYGRIVHLQPMEWLSDGWPVIGEDPDGDGVGQPVSSWPSPFGTKQKKGFMEEAWQWSAIPSPYWMMPLENGFRLYAAELKESSLWEKPNLLLKKFPAESFNVRARMSFQPNPSLKEKGEQAGFVVMGNDYAALRITDTKDGALLQLVTCRKANKGGEEVVSDLALLPYGYIKVVNDRASGNVPAVNYPDLPIANLWVKLEVKPQKREGNVPDAVCRLSYSLDGKHFKRIEETFIAQPELWIGAKYGFWCSRTAHKNDSGWVDIQDIEVY